MKEFCFLCDGSVIDEERCKISFPNKTEKLMCMECMNDFLKYLERGGSEENGIRTEKVQLRNFMTKDFEDTLATMASSTIGKILYKP